MKIFIPFLAVTGIVFAVMCCYWYFNPQRAPSYFRDMAVELKLPKPTSPMRNFKPPKF